MVRAWFTGLFYGMCARNILRSASKARESDMLANVLQLFWMSDANSDSVTKHMRFGTTSKFSFSFQQMSTSDYAFSVTRVSASAGTNLN